MSFLKCFTFFAIRVQQSYAITINNVFKNNKNVKKKFFYNKYLYLSGTKLITQTSFDCIIYMNRYFINVNLFYIIPYLDNL